MECIIMKHCSMCIAAKKLLTCSTSSFELALGAVSV